jgi:hypothetical protein
VVIVEDDDENDENENDENEGDEDEDDGREGEDELLIIVVVTRPTPNTPG